MTGFQSWQTLSKRPETSIMVKDIVADWNIERESMMIRIMELEAIVEKFKSEWDSSNDKDLVLPE